MATEQTVAHLMAQGLYLGLQLRYIQSRATKDEQYTRKAERQTKAETDRVDRQWKWSKR